MYDSLETRQMNARIAAAEMRAGDGASQTGGQHPVTECAKDASCSRMSARTALEQRYEALRREADGIHALLQALPGTMQIAAEEALWKIVVDQRR